MTGGSRLSTDALREAIQKRADETSLRDVADEIGIPSYTALGRFLRGETKRPQPRTLRLMMDWYYRRESGAVRIPRSDIDSAIAVLHRWVREGPKPKRVNERRLEDIVKEIREE